MIDTNVFVHSFDCGSGEKQLIAQALIAGVFEGSAAAVSAQTLAEFVHVVTKKIKTPITFSEASSFVDGIDKSEHWQVVSYSAKTVTDAAKEAEALRAPFWDTLLAITARENGVGEIVTENTRDFRKFRWLKATNPFRRHYSGK